MVFRMEVGNIRYGADPAPRSQEELGPLLGNSSVSNLSVPSELYSVELINNNGDFRSQQKNVSEAIANGIGSPFDKCLQLVYIAVEQVKENPSLESGTWKEVIDKACDSTDPGVQELCAQFPGDSKYNAPTSCAGYDNFPGLTAPYAAISGLVNEVTNAKLGTHLYMIKMGLQRFLQGLLYVNGTVPISPLFGKELVSVEVNGTSPVADARSQVSSINVDTLMEGSGTASSANSINSAGALTLKFSDGSSVKAKNAFLTLLPYDLPRIGGFEPWEETLQNNMSPSMAVKLVMGWEDAAEAPAARLGLKSCAGDGTCQRVILDGPADENWLVRQVWMWSNDTVMVYNVAGDPTKQGPTAANNMITLGTEEGMDVLVKTTMEQINKVANLEKPIAMPTWARIKPWPAGSITAWNNATQGKNIASYIERPLGASIPVFYGNSEAAPNSDEHGWIQGGWNMVEDNLPALAKSMGLKKDLQRYNPPDYTIPTPNTISATARSAESAAIKTAAAAALCGLLAVAL